MALMKSEWHGKFNVTVVESLKIGKSIGSDFALEFDMIQMMDC